MRNGLSLELPCEVVVLFFCRSISYLVDVWNPSQTESEVRLLQGSGDRVLAGSCLIAFRLDVPGDERRSSRFLRDTQ